MKTASQSIRASQLRELRVLYWRWREINKAIEALERLEALEPPVRKTRRNPLQLPVLK